MSCDETGEGGFETQGQVPVSLPQPDGDGTPLNSSREDVVRRIKSAEPLLPPDCGVCNLGGELDVDLDTFEEELEQ